MLIIQTCITLIAVYTLYSILRPIPENTPGMACLPRYWLYGSALPLAAVTVLLWLAPHWGWALLGAICAYPVLKWRNGRIFFDKKGFTISGFTGLRYEWSYGDITAMYGLSGRWLRVGWHWWYLPAGMRNMSAFFSMADMGHRLCHAGKGIKGTSRRNHQRISELPQRLLIFALFTAMSITLFVLASEPPNEDTGSIYTLVLQYAEASSDTHLRLYFAGEEAYFSIPRTASTEALLEADALGQTCQVQASHHSSRRRRHWKQDYYTVYALEGEDGQPYYTLEEAIQAHENRAEERAWLLAGMLGLSSVALFIPNKYLGSGSGRSRRR